MTTNEESQQRAEELPQREAPDSSSAQSSHAKRRGMIYAALERLDGLMAIGESRRRAKQEAHARGEAGFRFSTGKIHSYQTRSSYQEHILHFLNWVRATHGIRHLEEVDAQADQLASLYLTSRRDAGYSPWTLSAERSALRLFFGNRALAQQVRLPPRTRTRITRSRLSVAQDQQFQPAHWQPLLAFLHASGLRRAEVSRVRVGDIVREENGTVWTLVRRGKGGKRRQVPVIRGEEQAVLAVSAGREHRREERVFERIPSHLDVHHYRRLYAQALYRQLSGEDPPHPLPGKRLVREAYDLEAVAQVSEALGHHRLDVVLLHYLS